MGANRFYRSTLTASTLLLLSSILICAQATGRKEDNCIKVNNDASKIICVCDEQYCDKFSFEWPQSPGQAKLVETTRAGLRFVTSDLSNSSGKPANNLDGTVRVRLEAKRQPILGWGGAFTDAAAINIKRLTPKLTEELLQSYYGADGLSYNFGRVPIAGSDFSTRPYSYDDSPGPDFNLTKWSLAREDLDYRIPTIKRAMEIVNSTGEQLKLFGSPWSPPKWMKDNKSAVRGFLIDENDVYQSYANYLVKFFEAYKEHGLEFWGATVQNEPISSYLPVYSFNSLQMGSAQAIKLIAKHLGPAIEAKGYTKDKFKLMVGDDSLGLINLQVPSVMKDLDVRKYVSGLAFHWYTSGIVAPYDSLNRVVDAIRDNIEFVMMTEACTGSMPGSKHVDLGSWERGESYANDIIEDLKRETGGWIDWNLALDEGGGPNWANNFVDSPIIVHKSGNKFYKQPMFYTLAHFSRLFKPKSIYTEVSSNGWLLGQLSFAAVQNEETGHLVVNILNKNNSPKRFSLNVEDRGALKHTIKSVRVQAKSMSTIVIKL